MIRLNTLIALSRVWGNFLMNFMCGFVFSQYEADNCTWKSTYFTYYKLKMTFLSFVVRRWLNFKLWVSKKKSTQQLLACTAICAPHLTDLQSRRCCGIAALTHSLWLQITLDRLHLIHMQRWRWKQWERERQQQAAVEKNLQKLHLHLKLEVEESKKCLA